MKLAPGSLLTTKDQLRLYEEQMGTKAAERQSRLADEKAGRCICQPQSVRRRWDGSKPTSRRVHAPDCPKWKPWMAEVKE